MKLSLGWFYTLLALSFPFVIKAQSSFNYSLHSFHNRLGLDADEVFGLAQDQDGILWIGSNKGLYCFDGSYARYFGYEEGIKSAIISRVYALADSTILAVGEKPSAIYFLKAGERKFNTISFKQHYNFKGNLACLASNRKGIYAHADNQLLYIEPDCQHVLNDSIIKVNSLTHTAEQGLLLTFLNMKGCYVHNTDSDELTRTRFSLRNHDIILSKTNDGHLLAWSQKQLWIKENGYDWINQEASDSIPKPFHILKGGTNNIWLAGKYQGLYHFDLRLQKLSSVDSLIDLNNVQITFLLEDEQQNVWISTAGRGLLCLRKSNFTKFTVANGLSSNYITTLHSDPTGKLWIGTNVGVNILQNIDLPHTEIHPYPSTGHVFGFSAGPAGRVFISSGRENTWNTDLKRPNGSEILIGQQLSLSKNLDNEIVIPNWFSVKYFSKIEDKNDSSKALRKTQFPGVILKHLYFNDQEVVLTRNAVYKKVDGSFEAIKIDLKDEVNGHLQMEFSDALFHSPNHLWISSSKGLLKWDGKDWRLFNRTHGLIDEHCRKLAFEHNSNRLWIGTQKGLAYFQNGYFQSYTKADGLPANQINDIEHDSIHNCIWIGTPLGLSKISCEDISSISNTPHLTKIRMMEIVPDSIISLPQNELIFNYDRNHLKIHFSNSELLQSNSTLYRYKLLGTNLEWQESGAPLAEFIALAPSDYTFLVQHKRIGSEWSKLNSLHFTIAKPFWGRFDFWAVILFLSISILVLFAAIRIKKIKTTELAKRQALITINQLELQALHYSMNPHFLFNSLNSIQQFIGRHKDFEAVNFVSEFSLLIRNNMEAMRTKLAPLSQELEQVERYIQLETHRLERPLAYNIQIDPVVSTEDPPIPPLLIQPFVENAIWHGIAPKESGGQIDISIDWRSKQVLEIKIQDNGIGLTKAKKNKIPHHHSIGLQLTEKRLNLLSSRNSIQVIEMYHSNGDVSGTLATIILHIT